MAEKLLEFAQGEACIADMGYDANRIRDAIQARGMLPVIPSNPSRKTPLPHDEFVYWLRHRVECLIHSLKRFRRVATRYEKTARNYEAFALLAGAMQWLN